MVVGIFSLQDYISVCFLHFDPGLEGAAPAPHSPALRPGSVPGIRSALCATPDLPLIINAADPVPRPPLLRLALREELLNDF